MRFRITRASDSLSPKAPPVPGAVMQIREVIATRPWGSFGTDAERLWTQFQEEGGRNHRKVTRHSTDLKGRQTTLVDYEREEDLREWFIEVRSLDDLLALQVQVGADLIVGIDDGQPTILIHDDYIE